MENRTNYKVGTPSTYVSCFDGFNPNRGSLVKSATVSHLQH